MDLLTDLSSGIDWFLESIPPGSQGPPGPPRDPDAVESALVEIEPLPGPRLSSPDFALESWVEGTLESGDPKILFPVAYQSHSFLLVELGGPASVAAPVWEYAFTDDNYVLAYPSLATMFRTCFEAAEVSCIRPPAEDRDRYSTYADPLGGDLFTAIVERHMSMSPHAERDRFVPVGDVRRWPPRWQHAQGVTARSLQPLGPTHTVQAFAANAAHGPVTGRIVGRFHAKGIGGFGPNGAGASFGLFSDETGAIQIVLPDAIIDVGGQTGDIFVEVELEANDPIVDEPVPDTRAIQDAALRGDVGVASEAAIEWAQAMQRIAEKMPAVRRMAPMPKASNKSARGVPTHRGDVSVSPVRRSRSRGMGCKPRCRRFATRIRLRQALGTERRHLGKNRVIRGKRGV